MMPQGKEMQAAAAGGRILCMSCRGHCGDAIRHHLCSLYCPALLHHLSVSSHSSSFSACLCCGSLGRAQVCCELHLASVPALPGALECLQQGIVSSLHASNARAALAVTAGDDATLSQDMRWALLCDPQTAGGLLAGVAAEEAAATVQELRAAGCLEAAIIGRVLPSPPPCGSSVESPLLTVVD